MKSMAINHSPSIVLDNISLSFSTQKKTAGKPLFKTSGKLELVGGQWHCLLGASGCGKSSLLRWIAGLIGNSAITEGQIHASDGSVLADQISYMAQQDLLLPWKTLLQNVCLQQQFKKTTGAEKNALKKQAIDLLQQFGLADHLDKYPRQLSGGMRQRAALARTLLQNQPIILMDEPFSALDAITRYQLQALSHQWLKDRTVILVTHDPQEALRLADHIWLMQQATLHHWPIGKLAETPTPREIDAALASAQQQLLAQLSNGSSPNATSLTEEAQL